MQTSEGIEPQRFEVRSGDISMRVLPASKIARIKRVLFHRNERAMVARIREEFETTARLDSGALAEFHEEKIRLLAKHAYETTEYYKTLFDGLGVDPASRPVSLRGFGRLPILTKQTIQHELEAMRSSALSPEEVYTNHTGGSTGERLVFYQDRTYARYAAAGHDWGFGLCGFRRGDRQAYLWGSDHDARAHKGLRGYVVDGFKRVLFVNTFNLTKESILKAAKLLSSWEPDFIWGYASSLVLLARVVESNGIRGIEPKAIQSSAEVLTPEQRSIVERAFRCRVFDRYGCREASIIAHECEAHDGLHVLGHNNYVEVVSDGRQLNVGELGRIVVTNLNNFAMPFIRYDTGDLGYVVDGECPCGSGYPRLGGIVGRVSDTVTSPNGALLHGEFFTHLFYRIDGVLQFKVVQHAIDTLEIQIVANECFEPEPSYERLRTLIAQHGDSAFDVDIKMCDAIPVSASGKYRFVESKVPVDV